MNFRKWILTLVATAVVLTLSSGISRADVLGPNNCGSCFGNSFLLQYNSGNIVDLGGSPDEKVYDVFLTINTTGYNGTGSFINSVAIKIASSDVFADSSLVAAPGGTGVWSFHNGGLSASNCDGSGSGFECAQDSSHAPIPFAGSYTWEFHYATTAALLTGSFGSSVKALYTKDSAGKLQAGITSEDITLQPCTTIGNDCGGGHGQGNVPEPGTIMLLGSGLALLSFKLRKKTARS